MEPKKIILAAVGRSGSHIVRKYLIDKGFYDVPYHPNRNGPGQWDSVKTAILNGHDVVVHTHSDHVPEAPYKWIYVFVERKSKFDVVCSKLIVDKTKEYINYDNVMLTPFVADINKFVKHYKDTLHRQEIINNIFNNYNWEKKIHLYYEDIIHDQNYLTVNLPYNGNYIGAQYSKFQKSPFIPKDYIINYDELIETSKNILQFTNSNTIPEITN